MQPSQASIRANNFLLPNLQVKRVLTIHPAKSIKEAIENHLCVSKLPDGEWSRRCGEKEFCGFLAVRLPSTRPRQNYPRIYLANLRTQLQSHRIQDPLGHQKRVSYGLADKQETKIFNVDYALLSSLPRVFSSR